MIRLNVKYNDKFVDITFPCGDQKLHDLLGETSVPLKRGFITRVYAPAELSLLEGSTHELDEINFLAKRMDSFDEKEYDRFCAGVQNGPYDNLQDFINLTYSLERYTLIKDIGSMEAIGKTHYLCVNGCVGDKEAPNYAEIGRALLHSGKGIYTEHGLLFVNENMAFNEEYDGQVFPQYYHRADILFGVEIHHDCKSEYVYLPDDDIAISKALCRLGASSPDECTFEMDDCMVDDEDWVKRLKNMLEEESIFDINAVAAAINSADIDLDKLEALIDYVGDSSPQMIAKLARNIDEFTYIKDAETYEDVGKKIIEEDDEFHLQLELEDFFDYDAFGAYIANEFNGDFTENGFVYIPTGISLQNVLKQGESITF